MAVIRLFGRCPQTLLPFWYQDAHHGDDQCFSETERERTWGGMGVLSVARQRLRRAWVQQLYEFDEFDEFDDLNGAWRCEFDDWNGFGFDEFDDFDEGSEVLKGLES
jgi:hypothetical protein